MPGGWKGDTADAFSGRGLTAEQRDMQAYVRRLLNWRKGSAAVSKGRTLHFAPFNGVYVYFRYTGQECVMVLMNKNPEAVQVDPKRFAEILEGKSTGQDAVTGETVPVNVQIPIPAKSTRILMVR
jgi:glycosidase